METREVVTAVFVATTVFGIVGCDRDSDSPSEGESKSVVPLKKASEPARTPSPSRSELANSKPSGRASQSSEEKSEASTSDAESASQKTVDREGPLGDIPIPDGWKVLESSQVSRTMTLGGGNYRRKVVAGMPSFSIDEKYPVPDLVMVPDDDKDYYHAYATFYLESPDDGHEVDIPAEMREGFTHLVGKSRHDPNIRREPIAEHLDCRNSGHIFVDPEKPEILACRSGDGAVMLEWARATEGRMLLGELFGVGMLWSRSAQARTTLFGDGGTNGGE